MKKEEIVTDVWAEYQKVLTTTIGKIFIQKLKATLNFTMAISGKKQN